MQGALGSAGAAACVAGAGKADEPAVAGAAAGGIRSRVSLIPVRIKRLSIKIWSVSRCNPTSYWVWNQVLKCSKPRTAAPMRGR